MYLTFPIPVRYPAALHGFTRVDLKPGEQQQVRFTLKDRDLSHVDPNGIRLVHTGRYGISVGEEQPGTGAPVAAGAFDIQGERTLPVRQPYPRGSCRGTPTIDLTVVPLCRRPRHQVCAWRATIPGRRRPRRDRARHGRHQPGERSPPSIPTSTACSSSTRRPSALGRVGRDTRRDPGLEPHHRGRSPAPARRPLRRPASAVDAGRPGRGGRMDAGTSTSATTPAIALASGEPRGIRRRS